MRKHRLKALIAVPFLATTLTVANAVVTTTQAHAWSSDDAPPTADNFEALRWCESTDDYAIDTGNGYYGAYQFSLETWNWLGYDGYPNEADPALQDQAAMDLYSCSNWDAWPSCSRYLGLRA